MNVNSKIAIIGSETQLGKSLINILKKSNFKNILMFDRNYKINI